MDTSLAEKAYNAYGQVTNFKNFRGEDMPHFADLPDKIQEAWVAAANSLTETKETCQSEATVTPEKLLKDIAKIRKEVQATFPQSRCVSLAITKIDESFLWLNAELQGKQ